MDVLDLRGASGTVYRFRRSPQPGAHPPIAGNYALVATGTHRLIAAGVLDDLSLAFQFPVTEQKLAGAQTPL